jgi:hypothetical protein
MSFACTLFSGIAIGLILGLAMRATRNEPRGVPAWVSQVDPEAVDLGALLGSESETVTEVSQ